MKLEGVEILGFVRNQFLQQYTAELSSDFHMILSRWFKHVQID